VVHGSNGVGKSRLVAHFSRLHKSNFSTTWWVNGKDKSSVLASSGALASRLPANEFIPNLAKAPSSGLALEQQASTVLEWLSRKENSKWLLIFDDVVVHQSAGTRSSDAYSIRDFFPPSDQGSILVITGDSDMVEVGESHALRNLGLQESLEFFDTGIQSRTEDGQTSHIEDQGNGPMISLLLGCS
jgi:energy-coupling factor transporter ATP-binding protein EcfA2